MPVKWKNKDVETIDQVLNDDCNFCGRVTILRLFAGLFVNLAMRIRALFPKSATTLGLVEHAFCGGEVLVIGPHLLGDSAQGYLLLNLREVEGQEEVLEDKDEEEEENEVDEKVKEARENAQLMHATC